MGLTIVSRLLSHARCMPNGIAFRYLQDIGSIPQTISYKELLFDANNIAFFLRGVAAPGDRVMLLFPPGIAYITALFGCFLAEMIAVPLYPPRRNVKSDRVVNVATSCQSTIALTIASELANMNAVWSEKKLADQNVSIYAVDNIPSCQRVLKCPQVDMASPALLQYTSGSTGSPKGVTITHKNIIANVSYLSDMTQCSKDDVFVNWLPLFHDLGLVTSVLLPIFLGAQSIIMAPATFVRNPIVWLKAISFYRGSICGAPNFAYDLCVSKVSENDLLEIDLSSWRIAYNAAEPVKASTLNDFTSYFSSSGFKAEAFYPSYGMAEATAFISGGGVSFKPIQLTVSKSALLEHKLELVDDNHSWATRIVSCGFAAGGHDIRIVCPETCLELSDGCVGEIWFSGSSVSVGYWQMDDLTNSIFNQQILSGDLLGQYLRTGDLGVVWGGELYVTGRLKDLIIISGKNYYPQDIEASVASSHKSIRRETCVAFTNIDCGTSEEMLIVVAEIEREYFRKIDSAEVVSAIRQCVSKEHSLSVSQVALLKPYKMPLTSSGKVQRREVKKLYQEEGLDALTYSDYLISNNYVPASSYLEKELSVIWSTVLKLDRVGITDSFYDLGGNSLAALEISAEIYKKIYPIEIKMEQQLNFPTIVELAQFIELKMLHKKNQEKSKENLTKRVIRI